MKKKDYSALAWERRVAELEAEGANTSDAQAVADAEFRELAPWGWSDDTYPPQVPPLAGDILAGKDCQTAAQVINGSTGIL